MLQPFVLFEKKYLPRLLSLKKIYLVTQSYSRAYDHFANSVKIDILVTDYDDPGLAKIHLNAVKHDKFGAIIDLSSEVHKKKFDEMLSGDQYQVFWSVVASSNDIKQRLTVSYAAKVRRYIDNQPNWKVSGIETVQVDGIEVTFGELFVTLKWRTQKLRIKFEDIEKA